MWHGRCCLRARPLPNPTRHTLAPLTPALLTCFRPAELLCFPLPKRQALSCLPKQSHVLERTERF